MASGGLEYTGFAVEPKLDCPHVQVSVKKLLHFAFKCKLMLVISLILKIKLIFKCAHDQISYPTCSSRSYFHASEIRASHFFIYKNYFSVSTGPFEITSRLKPGRCLNSKTTRESINYTELNQKPKTNCKYFPRFLFLIPTDWKHFFLLYFKLNRLPARSFRNTQGVVRGGLFEMWTCLTYGDHLWNLCITYSPLPD